nr:uncharacterized protein LOC126518088 isoform X2 [Dermacentor andersoni]
MRANEVLYVIETSLNLISDVAMLHALYRPPRILSVLLDWIWLFVIWNAGTTIICVGSRLLGSYIECRKKILFMSCAFQYAIIFIFKFTLLSVVYRFYEELRAKTTQRNVVHRVEAGDAGSQDFTHKTT